MSEIEVLPVNPKQSPQTVIFSKYEVGKLLGCGAFAKVYHARDIKNGKSVAIKVINKKKLKSTDSMSNIIREISIMRRLHHPHIVQLFEVLATKTKIFVVMEHVKGGELFAKVSKGRLSENLSRKYFQQLISAVSYCHSHGIYHRDLKPENLLLDDNGDLKVTDFGLSAVNDQVSEDGLLHTLCGTPAYVAPEILARKGYEGAKVDVWSCGIILYVLICGYLPFNDPNLMVMYKKIYKGEFRCPKWISADLKRFLTRLLNTDPSTRITIEEIKRDPWFKKGYKETKIADFEEDFGGFKDEKEGMDFMNAFDLISFSSGLDISGLIEQSGDPVRDSQQLVVEFSPESIMERVETVAKELENFRLNKKKDWSVELQGQNGKMAIKLLVHRLTDRLSVVDVKRRAGDARLFQELMNGKLLPAIHSRSESQDSRP